MKDIQSLEPGEFALVVPPSSETLGRLQDIMGGSPIEINWDLVCLYLVGQDGAHGLRALNNAEYEVKFTDFGFFYDEELGHSALVGYVEGDKLTARLNQLGQEQGIVMFSNTSRLARSNRSFVTSVSNTLVAVETNPFVFRGEVLLTGN